MQDVQNSPAEVAVSIDQVGIKDLPTPLLVRDRAQGRQHTVASVDMGVELPSSFKGTHMSRFVEALENWGEELDYKSVRNLLEKVTERLDARKAYVVFKFPYFLRKSAPASKASGLVCYQCEFIAELEHGHLSLLLRVDVPVMTVCPCSKAISDEGAHSQRTMVRITTRLKGFAWLEDFIDIAEHSGSSSVYTLLKREDEKFVTENAFANPTFVEDVVRNAAAKLAVHPQISWFRVEVESLESIHCHNAFACIEREIPHESQA